MGGAPGLPAPPQWSEGPLAEACFFALAPLAPQWRRPGPQWHEGGEAPSLAAGSPPEAALPSELAAETTPPGSSEHAYV